MCVIVKETPQKWGQHENNTSIGFNLTLKFEAVEFYGNLHTLCL